MFIGHHPLMPTGVRFLTFLTALAMPAACAGDRWPEPEAVDRREFVEEFNEWRESRRSALVEPRSGPLTWIGLWELAEGAALRPPRLAGTFHRSGDVVRFEPAAGARIRLEDGAPVTTTVTLASDRTDSATVLASGSLHFMVHGESGTERLWLRGWDEEHPARATFSLPEHFEPDPAWRVPARFEPFREPREYQVDDILGGTQTDRSPGTLAFRIAGQTHRLIAFAGPRSRTFFITFWDSTAASTTYEAGRYMRAELPNDDGWTVIDFNRAYNPPCVFTEHSTCTLPPPENRLALSVLAGEKRAERR